jgi:hypothetical protein
MTFPTGQQATTTNLALGTNNPASARGDILAAFNLLNSITAEVNTANNVVVLNGNAQIPSTCVPAIIAPDDTLTLRPSTKFVKIESYLRMQVVPKATALAKTDIVIGDVVLYADDLTGANAGLAIYDGTDWKIIAELSSLTTLS